MPELTNLEELQVLVGRLQGEIDVQRGLLNDAAAEVERLRAALERYANPESWNGWHEWKALVDCPPSPGIERSMTNGC